MQNCKKLLFLAASLIKILIHIGVKFWIQIYVFKPKLILNTYYN
jgi:hypothetical protein